MFVGIVEKIFYDTLFYEVKFCLGKLFLVAQCYLYFLNGKNQCIILFSYIRIFQLFNIYFFLYHFQVKK